MAQAPPAYDEKGGVYPPAQGAYPPQQYPPQQYPPQQYPPQQYPPQQYPPQQYPPQPGQQGMSGNPMNVVVERWKCEPGGARWTQGPFLMKKADMIVQPGETVQQLIGRLSSNSTAPVGMTLEGPVIAVMAQDSGPEVSPAQFPTMAVLSIVNMAQPRLILKVNYGPVPGPCDDCPLILCTVM